MSSASFHPVRRVCAHVAAAVCVASVLIQVSAPANAATAGGVWHLDEASVMTVADSSGFGSDGIVHGDVQVGLPGQFGTAYSFAAAGSWVEVPSSPSLNPGHSDFKVTAWVNFTRVPDVGETYDIVRKGLSGTRGGEFKLEIVRGGWVRCTAKDSEKVRAVIASPRISLADGQWHQIGCERVGSTWRVIMDARTRSKSVSLGSVSNAKSLAIGSKYGREDGTPGRVDEVEFSIG